MKFVTAIIKLAENKSLKSANNEKLPKKVSFYAQVLVSFIIEPTMRLHLMAGGLWR